MIQIYKQVLKIISQYLCTSMLYLTNLFEMVVAFSHPVALVFFSFTVHRRFLNFQSWMQFVLLAFFLVVSVLGSVIPFHSVLNLSISYSLIVGTTIIFTFEINNCYQLPVVLLFLKSCLKEGRLKESAQRENEGKPWCRLRQQMKR